MEGGGGLVVKLGQERRKRREVRKDSPLDLICEEHEGNEDQRVGAAQDAEEEEREQRPDGHYLRNGRQLPLVGNLRRRRQ